MCRIMLLTVECKVLFTDDERLGLIVTGGVLFGISGPGANECAGAVFLTCCECQCSNYQCKGEIEWVPGWEGQEEKIKYSIDGKKLTIIRNYGEEHPNDPEVFTKQ